MAAWVRQCRKVLRSAKQCDELARVAVHHAKFKTRRHSSPVVVRGKLRGQKGLRGYAARR
jgi:hypothetical protein